MQVHKRFSIAVVLSLTLLVGSAFSQLRAQESLPGSTFGLVMREYDQWASVQKIYPPEKVKEMRDKFIDKAAQLRGEELEELLQGVHEKLQILLSAEASEARYWLTRTLATAADSKAAKIKAKLPDVARLSAAELEEQLANFARDRAYQLESYSEFNKVRSAQVKGAQATAAREAQASARARSSSGGGGYSGYVPSAAPREHKRTPLPSYMSGGYGYGYSW